jgi:hypothetical protein
VKKCVVNAEAIERRQRPLLLTRAGQVLDVDADPDLPRSETA